MKQRGAVWMVMAGMMAIGVAWAQEEVPETTCIPILAPTPTVVYESPDPLKVFAYSPGLAILPSGRLVATMDRGGKHPTIRVDEDGRPWRGRIYTSDDHGQTWVHRSDMPIYHARPFAAGRSVYVIGHSGDLGIVRSDDGGETWSEAAWLTEGERWHQAPSNVHYAGGKIYLVMERDIDPDYPEWPVSVFAPVILSAKVGADLTERASWQFSSELTYREVLKAYGKQNLVGIPFFTPGNTVPEDAAVHRPMAHVGWLETNIVQFTDPNHVWYDPSGRTFHLWMRAHTGSTNLAAIAKGVEDEDGKITISVERAPSGEPMVFVPCPGGQMKFHILYDDESKLFWLLSTQATDSMCQPARLPKDRFNLPNNERHRLVLHFSCNCMDWCFAGRVDDTGAYGQARHYASMVIDGDDLHVLSRSGDERAKSAHDTNLITFHTIHDFRKLVY